MGSIIFAVTILVLLILYYNDEYVKKTITKERTNLEQQRNSTDITQEVEQDVNYKKLSSHPQKYQYLINLLNGDKDAANRLVVYYLDKFPNRPSNWIIDKAISDLHRDRY